jgi:hypothetical protein
MAAGHRLERRCGETSPCLYRTGVWAAARCSKVQLCSPRCRSPDSPPNVVSAPWGRPVHARSGIRRARARRNGDLDPRENPHIRYFNGRRGYVRTRIAADEMRADFRVLPYVSRPGAPVRTWASFVVPDRDPSLYAT